MEDPDGSKRPLHKFNITPSLQEFNDRSKTRELRIATENYTQLFGRFAFGRYLWNSVFITVVCG